MSYYTRVIDGVHLGVPCGGAQKPLNSTYDINMIILLLDDTYYNQSDNQEKNLSEDSCEYTKRISSNRSSISHGTFTPPCYKHNF